MIFKKYEIWDIQKYHDYIFNNNDNYSITLRKYTYFFFIRRYQINTAFNIYNKVWIDQYGRKFKEDSYLVKRLNELLYLHKKTGRGLRGIKI